MFPIALGVVHLDVQPRIRRSSKCQGRAQDEGEQQVRFHAVNPSFWGSPVNTFWNKKSSAFVRKLVHHYLGHFAVIVLRMPPRAVNSPITVAEWGWQAVTISSRIRLMAFS